MMGDSVECRDDQSRLDCALVEYKALRDEVLKRIELRQRISIANLTIAGLFIGFAIRDNAIIALAYPPLAGGLVLAWRHSDTRIGEIGQYIHDRIEKRFKGGFGWEEYILGERKRDRSIRYIAVWHLLVVFLFPQLIAIVVGLSASAGREHLPTEGLSSGISGAVAALTWEKVLLLFLTLFVGLMPVVLAIFRARKRAKALIKSDK